MYRPVIATQLNIFAGSRVSSSGLAFSHDNGECHWHYDLVYKHSIRVAMPHTMHIALAIKPCDLGPMTSAVMKEKLKRGFTR